MEIIDPLPCSNSHFFNLSDCDRFMKIHEVLSVHDVFAYPLSTLPSLRLMKPVISCHVRLYSKPIFDVIDQLQTPHVMFVTNTNGK